MRFVLSPPLPLLLPPFREQAACPTDNSHRYQQQPTTISIADELAKLAKLKEQGVISESEFQQMKDDLLKRA
jgi:hypothetical protein